MQGQFLTSALFLFRQCADGLFCYHRNHDELPVPGCEGRAPSSADYCVSIAYLESVPNVATDEEEQVGFDDPDMAAEAEREDGAWEESEVDLVLSSQETLIPSFWNTDDITTSENPSTNAPTDSIVSPAMALASQGPSESLSTEAPTSSSSLQSTGSETTISPSDALTTVSPTSAFSVESTLHETAMPDNSTSDIDNSITQSPSSIGSTAFPWETANLSFSEDRLEDRTFAPTTSPSALMELSFQGNDGIFETFPLDECEGDCDSNSDVSGLLLT